MTKEQKLADNAFHAFSKEAPGHAEAWMNLVQGLSIASALDQNSLNLAYLALVGNISGLADPQVETAHCRLGY